MLGTTRVGSAWPVDGVGPDPQRDTHAISPLIGHNLPVIHVIHTLTTSVSFSFSEWN